MDVREDEGQFYPGGKVIPKTPGGGGEPAAYLKSIEDGTGKVVVTRKNNTQYEITAEKVGAAAASHTHAGFVLRADFSAIDPETVSVYELARILKTGAI